MYGQGYDDKFAGMQDNKYLQQAREEQPEGMVCGFCGKNNDFADDIGFFYISPNKEHEGRPTCKSCYDGPPGTEHKSRCGVGER